MFNLIKVTLVQIKAKITVVMPFYDFIVKFQNSDLVHLFTPYYKRDESQIDSDGLKLSVVCLFIVSKSV